MGTCIGEDTHDCKSVAFMHSVRGLGLLMIIFYLSRYLPTSFPAGGQDFSFRAAFIVHYID